MGAISASASKANKDFKDTSRRQTSGGSEEASLAWTNLRGFQQKMPLKSYMYMKLFKELSIYRINGIPLTRLDGAKTGPFTGYLPYVVVPEFVKQE